MLDACSEKSHSGKKENDADKEELTKASSAESSEGSGKREVASPRPVRPTADTATSSFGEEEERERESRSEPPTDQIGEDCVAFVRSTKTVASGGESSAACPECPTGQEVLKFDSIQVDEVSSNGTACEVSVTIRATFNPSKGGSNIGGGLTGWIPAPQRAEYLRGQTPTGQQTYKVKISYRRRGHGWRAAEFH